MGHELSHYQEEVWRGWPALSYPLWRLNLGEVPPGSEIHVRIVKWTDAPWYKTLYRNLSIKWSHRHLTSQTKPLAAGGCNVMESVAETDEEPLRRYRKRQRGICRWIWTPLTVTCVRSCRLWTRLDPPRGSGGCQLPSMWLGSWVLIGSSDPNQTPWNNKSRFVSMWF